MICLYLRKGEADRLDPASLVGRIAMRDGDWLWTSVSRPGRVVEARGRKLILDEIPKSYVPDPWGDGGRFILVARREPERGTMMLTAVRAVVDTPEEALLLLNHSSTCSQEFTRWKDARHAELLALATPDAEG